MAEAPVSDDKTVAKEATEELNFVVEGEEDPKVAAKKTDDEDEDGNDGETDDERERIREARRIERRERRERRAEARERDKYEIRALEQANREMAERLAALEGRTLQQDARQVDERLSLTLREHEQAERVLADAIAKGDGQLAARALRVRDEAREKARELQGVKARVSEAPRVSQGPDPKVARLAQDWAEDNDWYNPNGNDPDSNIVLAIDQALAAEGMDPRTEEYWDELDARAARALPHRYKKPTRKSPPVSGGRDGVSTTQSAKTFVVSAERKKAMIESGAWDDPVRRAKQIRAFAEYDKQNSRR